MVEPNGRRLMRLEMLVHPDYSTFWVLSPGARQDGPAAPPPPSGKLVSASRDALWISCGQGGIQVTLILEEWDQAPAPTGQAEGWEAEAEVTLWLNGFVAVDMMTAGMAVGSLYLQGGPGYYRGRLEARNRERVAQQYSEVLARYQDPVGPETTAALDALTGLERYRLQLWLIPGQPFPAGRGRQ